MVGTGKYGHEASGFVKQEIFVLAAEEGFCFM
jgi:hypothetical protein